MVRVEGGTFRMGSDRHYPEEAPAHQARVDGFWIERTPVTNRQFRAFVMQVYPPGQASASFNLSTIEAKLKGGLGS